MPRRPDTPPRSSAPPEAEVDNAQRQQVILAAEPATAASSAPADDVVPRKDLEIVHIAIQGCCHGELDLIYAACREHEAATGRRISFLLCCGDFQSVRTRSDLDSMAVPDKYKVMGDFHKYASGQTVAPFLTIFIGGNHEASNLLFREYCGGFVAPNIYYLGHAGVVEVCGVVVSGLSGIYKGRDFDQPYPVPPYTPKTVREAYHVRRVEVEKLRRFGDAAYAANPSLRRAVDIVMSHDWPVGITKYGDEFRLLRQKPYFEDDLRHGALGNPHLMPLLQHLRPKFWLSAHLHCHFTATVPHSRILPGGRSATTLCSPTQFIALDKCVHQRTFLDFIDIEAAATRKGDSNSSPSSASSVALLQHHPLWVDVVKQTYPPPLMGVRSLQLEARKEVVALNGGLEDGGPCCDLRCSSTKQLVSQLGLPLLIPDTSSDLRIHAPRAAPQPQVRPGLGCESRVLRGQALVTAEVSATAVSDKGGSGGTQDGACEWFEDTG